jgi:uncharacterized protein (TIGR03435 family)
MHIGRLSVLAVAFGSTASIGTIQTTPAEPRFDVVSIKRNASDTRSSNWVDRPDGGLRAVNIPAMLFVARAYPPGTPKDIVGLAEWMRNERYDVIATSSLSHATTDDRLTMMRAMLADRLKLVVHLQNVDQPVYELVLARNDGRLGPGLTPTEIDCEAQLADTSDSAENERRRALRDTNGPAPRCALRVNNTRLEGDSTMANLAASLRPYAGQPVIDMTGLGGYYRITMRFDPIALLRSPGSNLPPPPDDAPLIFTAIQQDLGLKLRASHRAMSTIVIDHVERPTEN